MLKMKRGIGVFFIVAAFLVAGCASILSKSSYPVAINSSPDQADFVITNKKGAKVYKGKTPSNVSWMRQAASSKGKNIP